MTMTRGFIKTVDLWNTDVVNAIASGELVLRPGQWVQCGNGTKSRLVGYNAKSGTFDVAHGGNGTEVNRRFSARMRASRLAKQRRMHRYLETTCLAA